MPQCVFCSAKFRAAERIIFEDGTCMAVPDGNPAEKGHLLVIPKTHYKDMLKAPDEVVMRVFAVAKLLGIRLEKKLGATGIKVVANTGKAAGQAVFHLHVHVIPHYEGSARKGASKTLTAEELAVLKTD